MDARILGNGKSPNSMNRFTVASTFPVVSKSYLICSTVNIGAIDCTTSIIDSDTALLLFRCDCVDIECVSRFWCALDDVVDPVDWSCDK